MSTISAHSSIGHRRRRDHRPNSNGSGTWRLNSALLRAAGDGDVAQLRKLIRGGANVNFRNKQGETALSFAAAWNQPATAKLLLSYKADPNIADMTGGTALMLAAQHGSAQLVRELLRHGADVHARDKADQTVLMHADWRPQPDKNIKRLLVKALNGHAVD
jgi:ankyrin repeat protein